MDIFSTTLCTYVPCRRRDEGAIMGTINTQFTPHGATRVARVAQNRCPPISKSKHLNTLLYVAHGSEHGLYRSPSTGASFTFIFPNVCTALLRMYMKCG